MPSALEIRSPGKKRRNGKEARPRLVSGIANSRGLYQTTTHKREKERSEQILSSRLAKEWDEEIAEMTRLKMTPQQYLTKVKIPRTKAERAEKERARAAVSNNRIDDYEDGGFNGNSGFGGNDNDYDTYADPDEHLLDCNERTTNCDDGVESSSDDDSSCSESLASESGDQTPIEIARPLLVETLGLPNTTGSLKRSEHHRRVATLEMNWNHFIRINTGPKPALNGSCKCQGACNCFCNCRKKEINLPTLSFNGILPILPFD